MAPLTWRNVDNPSFASANDLFRLSSDLMNSGFGAARRGLNDFRDITTEDQSAALMQSIMNAGNDPNAMQAAIQGANPSFLSPEALRFANAQPGVLLEREGTGLRNTQTGQNIRANDYNFNRTALLDQRSDAQRDNLTQANPLIAQAYQAARNGDWDTANQIFNDNLNLFNEAGIDSLATLQSLYQGRTAGWQDQQNAYAQEDWARGALASTNARDLMNRAIGTFGSEGKQRVMQELQALAGREGFDPDMLREAIGMVEANDSIFPQAEPVSRFDQFMLDNGGQIDARPQQGQPTDIGWTGRAPQSAAQSPYAQTGNQIFDGFMGTIHSAGVTNPYALAAIHATGVHESGFSAGNANRTWSDPSQSGQAGTAGGIMSWRGSRLSGMQRVGTSPEAQAQYFLQEDPDLINRLNNAGSLEEAMQLMNNAWRFAGYNQPGGEAGSRLATAQSVLPAYMNGESPPVGAAGRGPTNANAGYMDRTGQNPLTTMNDLMMEASGEERRQQDVVEPTEVSRSQDSSLGSNRSAPAETIAEPAAQEATPDREELSRMPKDDLIQMLLDRALADSEFSESTIDLPDPAAQPEPVFDSNGFIIDPNRNQGAPTSVGQFRLDQPEVVQTPAQLVAPGQDALPGARIVDQSVTPANAPPSLPGGAADAAPTYAQPTLEETAPRRVQQILDEMQTGNLGNTDLLDRALGRPNDPMADFMARAGLTEDISRTGANNAPPMRPSAPEAAPEAPAREFQQPARPISRTPRWSGPPVAPEASEAVPEAPVDVPQGATDSSSVQQLLDQGDYIPLPEDDIPDRTIDLPAGANPDSSEFMQNQQRHRREGAIIQNLRSIAGDIDSGAYSEYGSPSLLDAFDTFRFTPEQRELVESDRELVGEAADWFRSQEAQQHFLEHPDQLQMAADNPINYAHVLMEQQRQLQGDAPVHTEAPQENQEEGYEGDTFADRMLAERQATLAPPRPPSELVSSNESVPLASVHSILMAQGTADQSSNIFGSLDRLAASPPTERTTPREVAVDTLARMGDDSDVTIHQVENAINELVSGGLSAPMAGEILMYAMNSAVRNGIDPRSDTDWVNMNAARQIRDAYLGVDEHGNISNAPMVRGMVRMGQVQDAVRQIDTYYNNYVALAEATQQDINEAILNGNNDIAEQLRESLKSAEALTRQNIARIEQSGLLSVYSNVPAMR